MKRPFAAAKALPFQEIKRRLQAAGFSTPGSGSILSHYRFQATNRSAYQLNLAFNCTTRMPPAPLISPKEAEVTSLLGPP